MIERSQIVDSVNSWKGTPYHHQASLKSIGCDCLGLLRGVFREVNGLDNDPEAPPAYSPNWAESGSGREDMLDAAGRHLVRSETQEIKPGSILFFRFKPTSPAKHCAIAVTEDRMVHAHSGKRVVEVSIVPWWRKRIAGVYEFKGVES